VQARGIKKYKAIKSNKETNCKHKLFVSRFEPLPPPPWRIFTKSTKGIYKRSTQDRSTELPPIQPLHKRDLNTKKIKVTRLSKRPHISLLQLLIEWDWFWLKKWS